MALSGLDIYKLLPKTNCKECGSGTCMAFAMRVAAKKSKIEECPHISDEAKANMAEDAPQGIKLIEFGPENTRIKIGGEKVLYRHEETFYNKTVFSVEVDCLEDINAIDKKLKSIFDVEFTILKNAEKIDALTLNAEDCSVEKLAEIIKLIKSHGGKPLIIKVNTVGILNYIAANLLQDKPIIYPQRKDNSFLDILKNKKLPVIISGKDVEDLSKKVQIFSDAGMDELVFCIENNKPAVFADLDILRKQSLKQKSKNLSFPVYAETPADIYAIDASFYICKYASIINFKKAEKEVLLPLFVLRNNIYQDPRKPIQVEAKLYEIGAVNETSPVAVTTNFSLTYFAVSSEIEGSRVPAYLLVVDTGGTSVLSAWASDKINADKISKAIKSSGLEEKVKHRNLIIPGYIYPVQEDLQEISGWKVLIGPKESKDLGNYLKQI